MEIEYVGPYNSRSLSIWVVYSYKTFLWKFSENSSNSSLKMKGFVLLLTLFDVPKYDIPQKLNVENVWH